MQKEAFEDILDQEFERMPAYGDILGRLKIAILRDRLQNGNHYVEERLRKIRDMVYKARTAADTIESVSYTHLEVYERCCNGSLGVEEGRAETYFISCAVSKPKNF